MVLTKGRSFHVVIFIGNKIICSGSFLFQTGEAGVQWLVVVVFFLVRNLDLTSDVPESFAFFNLQKAFP